MKVLISVTLLFHVALAFPVEQDDTRIVGGYPAQLGQFPYQVSLELNGQHSCGGSIISQTTILTAAHCVYGISGQIYVRAGIVDLFANSVRIRAAQILIHSGYNPQSTTNDIALIRLASLMPLSGNIQQIPMRGQSVNPGETLTLSGWGLTSYRGSLPYHLQYIQLGAIDLYTCANKLAGANPITNGHVCTSSPNNQGACQGDSGGPLIDAHGAQIGVVSWGIPCAKGFPDVFTSVPFYLEWIRNSAKTYEDTVVINLV